MLLLKRRVGESIVIGGSIRVSVVEVRGGSVRIAIDAPSEFAVYRAELLEKLGEENARAVGSHVRASRRPMDSAIDFPEGILGMGDNKAFVLYDLDDDYRALVARDEPMLSLLLIDPLRVDPNYPIERAFARYPFGDEELAIAAVVTNPMDGSTATVNLAAPVVFGVESRRAVQVLLDDERLSLRAPIETTATEVHAP
ncbi:MAG: carbon storage regulator, CsrA [Myxococcaceae bacterium]|nr:carbon storage regulator, CsrA [Myxococcaceae bacterium]